MKTLIRLSPLTLAACALFGCDQRPFEPGADGLIATHVGGHLGSYRDCPEQAWESVGTDRPDGVAEADGARRPDADCADDQCGPLNCEAARLTFELSNGSDLAADGVEAVALYILDRDGAALAELPIGATLDGDGQPFGGDIAAGARALLHVEFAAPLDVDALLGPPDDANADGVRAWQSGARLHLVVGAASHEDAELITPELFSLPEVDT